MQAKQQQQPSRTICCRFENQAEPQISPYILLRNITMGNLYQVLVLAVATAAVETAAFLGAGGLPLQHTIMSQSLTQRGFHFGGDLESSFAEAVASQALLTHPPLPESELNEVFAASTKATSAMTAIATTTPELESEVLLDVSHLFLDFAVFVTDSKPLLKVAQVVGRLLLLIQDYIPDQHVSPEELGIQVLMISVCLSKQQQEKKQIVPQNKVRK